jgi:hypothetical protein
MVQVEPIDIDRGDDAADKQERQVPGGSCDDRAGDCIAIAA